MGDSSSLATAPGPSRRHGLGLLGLLALVAAAVVGGNLFGLRDSLLGTATPSPRAVATSPFVRIGGAGARARTVLRSQPWWQGVAQLRGAGGTSAHTFTIDPSASQWRARWACHQGRLTARIAGRAGTLIDASCPTAGTTSATRAGSTTLSVSATGSWSVRIDQQVDVPLVEPPLAAMSAPGSTLVSSSRFYRIDQTGTGRVSVYRLASGRFALRLDRFYITPNVDLQLRLSPLRSPHSTRQYLRARSMLVAPLDVTTGSLNFLVPSGVDPTRYGSLVVWCPLIDSAYAAAPLVR